MTSVNGAVGSRTVKVRVMVTGAPVDRTKSSKDRAVNVAPNAPLPDTVRKRTTPKNATQLLCVPFETTVLIISALTLLARSQTFRQTVKIGARILLQSRPLHNSKKSRKNLPPTAMK